MFYVMSSLDCLLPLFLFRSMADIDFCSHMWDKMLPKHMKLRFLSSCMTFYRNTENITTTATNNNIYTHRVTCLSLQAVKSVTQPVICWPHVETLNTFCKKTKTNIYILYWGLQIM